MTRHQNQFIRKQPFLGCLAAAVLVVLPAEAGIVKGPHLQNVAKDGITIVWRQENPGASGVTVDGAFFAGSGELVKEARIAGLLPDTTYQYAVDADQETFVAEFTTAPESPSTPFTFVVAGDTRTLHDDHQAVVNQIAAEDDVSFTFNTGDMVSSGASDDDWQYFFDIEAALVSRTPWYPCVGNHDLFGGTIPDLYLEYLAPPVNSSGSEAYYSFTYGNSAFIVLDEQANVTVVSDGEASYTDFDQAQKTWLLATLIEYDADESIRHVFIVSHVPAYSSKAGRFGSHALRLLNPVFKQFGVDMVFSGHNHYLERGESPDGVRYIVSGAGGAPLYVNESEDNLGYKPGVALPWLDDAHTVYFAAMINGYIKLSVNGDVVTSEIKDNNGELVDFSYWVANQEDEDQDAGPDSGSDSDSDTDTDSDSDSDTDTDSDSDTDSDADVDSGADTDSDADTDSETGTETDTGGSDTATDTDTEIVTPVDLNSFSQGGCGCSLVGI